MIQDTLDLEEIKKFREIIGAYKPDPNIIEDFSRSDFVVIAGPAVSGKDTLRESLLKNYPDYYHKVLSLTTRSPRNGEVNTYDFITIDQMKKLVEEKKLLQLALVHDQQVSATDIEEIRNIPKNKIGLSILIVQAEQVLSRINSGIRTVFMVPPGFEEFIRRIKKERIVTDQEINRRLTSARTELHIALESDRYYFVISDTLDNAFKAADEFLRLNRINEEYQNHAKKLCQDILIKLDSI